MEICSLRKYFSGQFQVEMCADKTVVYTPGKKASLFPSIHSSLIPASWSSTSGCWCKERLSDRVYSKTHKKGKIQQPENVT